MKQKWKVLEGHRYVQHGNAYSDMRVVSVCQDRDSARRELSNVFDERWNEHLFPPDLWLSECVPPEESPDNAWFVSKFPDEGEFRFRIEQNDTEVSE